MDQLLDFINGLFESDNWPARWSCGIWSSFHGWLYIISSFLIASAYFVIPILLYRFIKKRSDIPFIKVFWLFIIFILACGTTHLIDGIIFWVPIYRISATVLFATALISWTAIFALYRVIPHALLLRSPKQLELIIQRRTAQLKNSNDSLRKINEDLDNYVYAASHDLKSPINNMEGLLELMRTKDDEINDKIIVEKLEESVRRVKNTITKLTDVIKLQKSPYDDVESNNLKEVVDDIIEENFITIKAADAKINTVFDVTKLDYSKSGLKQILYNLLINAIKYKHPDRLPVIDIRFYKKNNRVFLDVEDNGLGIDLEKYQDRIFLLFKRLHTHVEGSGIGLYSIKQLIEKKGGSICVSSQLNKGSIFTVEF